MGLRVQSKLPAEVEDLIRRVIGAAIEVHRHLSPGYLESIYEEALCHEFSLCGIPYERQKTLIVRYKEKDISGQRLDLLVAGKIIVELKAIEEIAPIHVAILLSYMKSTGIKAGLIINFRVRVLKSGIRRFVL